MDDILEEHEDVLSALTEGYKHLVEHEAGDGLWQPDQDSIVRVYGQAVAIAERLPYEAGAIESFCTAALGSDDPDFFLMGPVGLYVSALVNASQSAHVGLDLGGQELRVPLLGYRLREGVRLEVSGHLGDLVGIALEGGHLSVAGNVGKYLGAGMTGGRIDVSGDAGQSIGEQMTGGEIHVQGRFGGVGKPISGAVYHRKQTVFEKAPEEAP